MTACVLTLNEEPRLAKVVGNLTWADRVIVVDAGSRDGTVDLARSLGVETVVHRQLDFASQRNFAMTMIRTEWVFWPDADWRIPYSLGPSVRRAIADPRVTGYQIPVLNIVCGAPLLHGPVGPEYKLRLHRVEGACWTGAVHERLCLPGDVERLDVGVVHDHTTCLDQRLAKVARDASLRAAELRAEGYRFRTRDLVWAPLRRAGGNLVFRGGALDGTPGLVFWTMRGIETFMTLANVWAAEQLERQVEENVEISDPSPASLPGAAERAAS
ncbi:MAG: glycosyltransferase family 2 protein [Acidimicrobiales bacterium]